MFLSFFFKYLFSARSGSVIRYVCIICICSLAVSIAGLLIVISVMSGFGISIRDRLLQEEPHLVVSTQKINSLKKTLLKHNLKNQINSIRSFEIQDVILKTSSGEISGAVAKGYTKKYFKYSESKSSVHLGMEIASQLRLFEGDKVFVTPAETLLLPPTEITPPDQVTISSITLPSHSSINNKTIFYQIGSIPSLKKNSSLENGVEIFLKNPDQYQKIQETIKNEGYVVKSWSERNSALFFALKVEKGIMIIFLSLASLIASFSIASMLQLLIRQKRKDIEILMVMGYPTSKVKKLFTLIAFTMSFIGVFIGSILGYIACFILQHASIDLLPDIYVNRKIPVEISLDFFVIVLLSACLLSYLASWVPMSFYKFSTKTIQKAS